jgi:hypothetical protein
MLAQEFQEFLLDVDFFHVLRRAKAEMQAHVAVGHETRSGANFLNLFPPGGRDGDSGSDSILIGFRSD